MPGFVAAKAAADAAETHANVCKTCTCMHTLRGTSDPHGHLPRREGGGAYRLAYHCRLAVSLTVAVSPQAVTMKGPGFRVQGVGFSVWGLEYRV